MGAVGDADRTNTSSSTKLKTPLHAHLQSIKGVFRSIYWSSDMMEHPG